MNIVKQNYSQHSTASTQNSGKSQLGQKYLLENQVSQQKSDIAGPPYLP